MPIDLPRLLEAKLDDAPGSWTPDDVILYHLGIGAGNPPDDPGELSLTYEKGLKVLPSFGVLAGQGSLIWLLGAPGFDVSLAKVLHGEQDIELHGPLPTSCETRTSGRVTHAYDKGEGKAAIVVLEATTTDASGNPLCTNRFTAFLRGEGGFGGETDQPAPEPDPTGDPDHVVDRPTLPQQALLYRLNGDKNPMHADPEFAKNAGFERPFLHGLCSYGIVCKAIVDTALDGDVSKVRRYRARFAGIFFPGETMRVQIWRDGDQIKANALSAERGTPVLSGVIMDAS